MNFTKQAKTVFVPPQRKLGAVMPGLQKLRRALHRASISDDPLTEIVSFFDAVSKWHDRGISDLITAFDEVNRGGYNEVLEKLRTLQEHFENAGRCWDGWNRTKHGETVTADKVFLGNIFGLWTKTVAYWVTCKNDPRGAWKGGSWDGNPAVDGKNAYDVVSRQASEFMINHISPMIAIINDLEVIAA